MHQVLANIRTIGQALGRSRKGLLPVFLLTGLFIGPEEVPNTGEEFLEVALESFLLDDDLVSNISFASIGPS